MIKRGIAMDTLPSAKTGIPLVVACFPLPVATRLHPWLGYLGWSPHQTPEGMKLTSYGGFLKWGYPTMDGLFWKIHENPNLKWMKTRGTPMSGNHHIQHGCCIADEIWRDTWSHPLLPEPQVTADGAEFVESVLDRLKLPLATCADWWFQSPWKILVNWDDYLQYMEK